MVQTGGPNVPAADLQQHSLPASRLPRARTSKELTKPGRSATVADRALPGQHDEALVWAFWAGTFPAAVHRGAEKVCPGVDTRSVDVVVFGKVAHGEDAELREVGRAG